MFEWISFLNQYVFGVAVPVLLIALGVFYCIRLRFFYILHPIKTANMLFGGSKGERVSSLKGLALALAGTLGVGNMVGVASAIALGGFGAVFWMWVSALVAMILKYAEIVLAMKYRRFDRDGQPYGSAMYYIEACFRGKTGKIIAAVFAILCCINAISMGSMIQVNAASSAMSGVFNVSPWVVGAVFSAIALWTMIRGTTGIMGVTEKLVPIMTVGFVILSLAALVTHPTETAEAFRLIFKNAFDIRSAGGGVVGFLLSRALRFGTMRGILSNEAGCGTAPAAHAVCECKQPARQGVFGIFEVFVDTVLLCTLTALVIIVGHSGRVPESHNFMMITVDAYSALLGNIAGSFISVSVVLFGLATVLCWGYYGMSSASYLLGQSKKSKAFIFIYAASVLAGAVISSEIIWECADFAIGAMTLINLAVLFIMNSEVKMETDGYFRRG